MSTPKFLESLLEEWEKDSVIDDNNLDLATVATAKMHAKYLKILSKHKLLLRNAELEQKTLLKDKYLYYEGKMCKEDIDARGWSYDPYDGLSVKTNKFKEHYYETDAEIQQSEAKLCLLQNIIDVAKEILDTLRWRHQTIKNLIEAKKMNDGY